VHSEETGLDILTSGVQLSAGTAYIHIHMHLAFCLLEFINSNIICFQSVVLIQTRMRIFLSKRRVCPTSYYFLVVFCYNI
jgi:hypothetical protein